MQGIVECIAASSEIKEYPIFVRQILCMHSRLPYEVNIATLKLAAKLRHNVCGIDLAGPDTQYASRMNEFVDLFQQARALGIKTTGHLYETENGCHPELLPLLDRIGHGIQIPLRFPELLDDVAKRGQCLEVCPTTYLKTGTMKDLTELREVFEKCETAGVDIAICTDNAGLHNVRLPFEIENLLTLDVIDFKQLRRCQEAAYRHAFAWPFPGPPDPLKHSARDLVL
jgi:adenosine deaminase